MRRQEQRLGLVKLLPQAAKLRLLMSQTGAATGRTGKRSPGEIGFASLRGGEVVGEHKVIFAGNSERIELSHTAYSRELFAKGAVIAAKWANHKDTGLYNMVDVLGI